MTRSDEDENYNLQRFVDAQDPVYMDVCSELRGGCKRTHWMWFIFPQLQGLGHSPLARCYAISSIREAIAYLNHPILGPRLIECCRLVNCICNAQIAEIFGFPDNLKFHSSITLFARAATRNEPFMAALDKYFDGKQDLLTTELLRGLK